MKALMSERFKKILHGCNGAHKKGITIAIANATAANKKEFEFHCSECMKTFKFEVTHAATIK
jgi:hypothetical protein